MPKLLRDFLHEQQEPFALDLYLLERGCNSSKISRFTRKKSSRNAVSNYADFFKSVFNRLVSVNGKKKIKNSEDYYDQEEGREKHAYVDHDDDDEFSSASSRTGFKSLSASEVEDTRDYYDVFPQKEVDAKTRLKRTSMEDMSFTTKQLSPVSVLEETESDEEEDSPLHHKQKHFKTTIVQVESSTSMSQHNRVQRLHHDLATSYSARCDHQYVVNKRILHESQKLLIDTVREVIEIQRQRDKRHEQLKKILGPDELWKLVCDYLWIWSQDLTDETNIVDLLHCDFLGSQEDWSNDYEMQKQVVCEQVADDILQELLVEILWS